MNPDIFIKPGAIEKLIKYMKAHKEIGVISPKVLNSDSTTQYLCKRYPTLYDVIIRFLFVPGCGVLLSSFSIIVLFITFLALSC